MAQGGHPLVYLRDDAIPVAIRPVFPQRTTFRHFSPVLSRWLSPKSVLRWLPQIPILGRYLSRVSTLGFQRPTRLPWGARGGSVLATASG